VSHLPTVDDDPRLDTTGPIRCETQCNRCHRVAQHDVRCATIHPSPEDCESDGWDGVVLGRIIECEGCGAVDDYALHPLSKLALTVRALAEQERVARSGERSATRVFAVGIAGLWDGTVVRRASHAIARLEALTRERPDSGEAWRRLATTTSGASD